MSVEPRTAVHIVVIVGYRIEGDKLCAMFRRPSAQELIEHLLPGGGVDLRGAGEDPIHVEQARRDATRDPNRHNARL